MRHVQVVLVSNRRMADDTADFLGALERLGAAVSNYRGSADLYASRNIALTGALRDAPPERDVILCVDDDIVARAEDTVRLCTWPRAGFERPARSAVYCQPDARLAANRRETGGWNTGFGLLAIQRAALLRLAGQVPWVSQGPTAKKIEFHAFCMPFVEKGRWFADDYGFTEQLGGADLDHECPAGHIKAVPLWPDDLTLKRIANGESLEKQT